MEQGHRGYRATNFPQNQDVYDRSLNIEYGYIIAAFTSEEEPRYFVLVLKEFSRVDPRQDPAAMPIEESYEYLASTYGSPENLVGLRVRIEYIGSDWKLGAAKIVPGRDVPVRGTLTSLPSRGFRYAAAGGSSLAGGL
jgi:hypothetical protein